MKELDNKGKTFYITEFAREKGVDYRVLTGAIEEMGLNLPSVGQSR